MNNLRQLKFNTEIGIIQAVVLHSYPTELSQLQAFERFFTVITTSVLDHALNGWTKPLVDALNREPKHILPMIPQKCAHEQNCFIYLPSRCKPTSSKCPFCFQIENVDAEASLWLLDKCRENVYILVVREDN